MIRKNSPPHFIDFFLPESPEDDSPPRPVHASPDAASTGIDYQFELEEKAWGTVVCFALLACIFFTVICVLTVKVLTA
ncbi:hypothetical protein E2C01_062961 [Portunus trituberculatus]|uniref:Uncharacterized protein n=1 Tax=Portunus trituberculatus TaxID=210409 RepID=A0A5B7HCH6_PORTR|nr:hypothetical protein [Portunus trituberculatus]